MVGRESVSGGPVDHLFKMIIVADDGPARDEILSSFSADLFEGDYLATIGIAMAVFARDVQGVPVKIAAWVISGNNDFAQLRKAYYQNTSLVLLVIRDTLPESIRGYKGFLMRTVQVAGRCPVLVVGGKGPDINQEIVRSFAKEIDTSYIVPDASNQKALEESIDRMLRDVLRAKDTLKY